MKKQLFNNVILISGSGRNCGKTTLACTIIQQLSVNNTVIGLKISPHVHITGNDQEVVVACDDYIIYRETNASTGKDSSRMLNSGADEVYFVQITDEHLPEIESVLYKLLPAASIVVCESGSFAMKYTPGIHLLVEGEIVDQTKESYIRNLKVADRIIQQKDIVFGLANYQIQYENKQWDFLKKKLQ